MQLKDHKVNLCLQLLLNDVQTSLRERVVKDVPGGEKGEGHASGRGEEVLEKGVELAGMRLGQIRGQVAPEVSPGMLQIDVSNQGEADVQRRAGRSTEINKGLEEREAFTEASTLSIEKTLKEGRPTHRQIKPGRIRGGIQRKAADDTHTHTQCVWKVLSQIPSEAWDF